jgi:heptosyltransferase-3
VAQQCPLPRGNQCTGNITVIQGNRPCIPCGLAGCDDKRGESPCLLEIEPDEVLAAVEKLFYPLQGEKR